MNLQRLTWVEVEQYLKRSTGIIIPIGSTEQHGPNGLMGTDSICPEAIAAEVGRRIELLVAPPINFGMAQHHLGFPGTIALRPSTLSAVVQDIVASLALHGFTHVLFVNGHGGNTATSNSAFSEYYAEHSFRQNQSDTVLRTKILNWWTLPRVKQLADELYPNAEGSHATPSEVSLSYYACGMKVPQSPLVPPKPSGDFLHAADFRRRFPDGRMGSNPALATFDAGKRFLMAAAEDVVEIYEKFIKI